MKALDVRALVKQFALCKDHTPCLPAQPAAFRSLELWGQAADRFYACANRPALVHSKAGAVALSLSTPSWVAPDPSLRKSIDDRIEASLPSADPPHGFYWREAVIWP